MNKKAKEFLFENKVVLLFAVLCVCAMIVSGQSLTFVIPELFTRIARNSFMVLSLIIPVIAGLGLNFGIVVGAMAAQIALFATTCLGLTGISGFLITVVLATPIATLFGYLVGSLFNHMKGSEMIGGLVLGYFADGIYQFIFLFVLGGIIPIARKDLMVPTGIGVKNTLDLVDTVKYSLDNVPMLTILEVGFYGFAAVMVISVIVKLVTKQAIDWNKTVLTFAAGVVIYALSYIGPIEQFLAADRLLLLSAVEIVCFGTVIWQVLRLIWAKLRPKKDEEGAEPAVDVRKAVGYILAAAVAYAITYIPAVYDAMMMARLPVMTYLCIAALCGFNSILLRTRLGQNMRTVGQSRVVANAAGINVDKTRIIAMILSTVLGSWGQLIYLQNLGTFQTYGAHQQVGQFAIAALLVGGASVRKATNRQAILGIILFHTLFILSPLAGKELFGDAVIGEYFRVFVSYGIIAMALAMHAWKKVAKVKPEAEHAGDKPEAKSAA